MTKTELVAYISEATALTRAQSTSALNVAIEGITRSLQNGESVSLIGFGTFSVSQRAERIGRNPQTGKEITISASNSPKFKAGKALKDAVN